MNPEIDGEINIYKVEQQPYAFTVKRIFKPKEVTDSDYLDIMAKWSHFGLIKCYEFEKDSHGILHIHGIILLRKGFYRKKLVIKGYSTRLDELYDETGWMRYIGKTSKPLSPDTKAFKDQYLFND
jgi:hypothetical protein